MPGTRGIEPREVGPVIGGHKKPLRGPDHAVDLPVGFRRIRIVFLLPSGGIVPEKGQRDDRGAPKPATSRGHGKEPQGNPGKRNVQTKGPAIGSQKGHDLPLNGKNSAAVPEPPGLTLGRHPRPAGLHPFSSDQFPPFDRSPGHPAPGPDATIRVLDQGARNPAEGRVLGNRDRFTAPRRIPYRQQRGFMVRQNHVHAPIEPHGHIPWMAGQMGIVTNRFDRGCVRMKAI